MNTLTHSTSLHAATRRDRAASLKQVVRHQLTALLNKLWQALEDTGRVRAAPHLLQHADRVQASDPALAAALREVARPRFVSSFTPPATTPASTR